MPMTLQSPPAVASPPAALASFPALTASLGLVQLLLSFLAPGPGVTAIPTFSG